MCRAGKTHIVLQGTDRALRIGAPDHLFSSAQMSLDDARSEGLACRDSMRDMDRFELRPLGDALELRGGKLKEPMVLREADAEQRAIHLIGFLSQRDASVLRILDAAGTVVAKKEFRLYPLATGAVGGLAGPS